MGEPSQSRTRWACAVCFEVFREKVFPFTGRRHARDRLRIGVCPGCALRARTAVLVRDHPAAAQLAPLLERIGRRIGERPR